MSETLRETLLESTTSEYERNRLRNMDNFSLNQYAEYSRVDKIQHEQEALRDSGVISAEECRAYLEEHVFSVRGRLFEAHRARIDAQYPTLIIHQDHDWAKEGF